MNMAILCPRKSAPFPNTWVDVTVLSRLPGAPVPVHSAVAVIQSDGGKRDYVEITAHLCMGLAVEASDVVIMLGFL